MTCESDDIGNDLSTAQLLEPGVTVASSLDVDCGDEDMFRIPVQQGLRYYVRAMYPSSVRFQLVDFRNWNYQDYARIRPGFFQTTGYDGVQLTFLTYSFVARYSGDYFVRMGDESDPRNANYELSYTQNSILDFGRIHRGVETTQTFEEGNTQKVFTFSLREGEQYALDVVGSEGTAPWIGTRSGDQNYYDAGTGNRARVTFTAEGGQGSGLYYATVGTDAPGDVQVTLSSIGDDHQIGTGTTSRIGIGERIIGNAETGSDIDWFRASLTAGEFYRVQLTGHGTEEALGTPLLIVRDPESNLIDTAFVPPPLQPTYDSFYDSDDLGVQLVFQAQSTGDHFFIARSKATDISGFYHLRFEQQRAPIDRKFQSEAFEEFDVNRFDVVSDEPIPISDLFSAPESSFEYQIFSSTLQFNDGSATQAANIVHNLSPSQIDLWSVLPGANGTHEIMIRARSAGKWSSWLKTPIVSDIALPSLQSGFRWLEPEFRHHFSESLPSYFDGVYSGFQSLAGATGESTLVHSLNDEAWEFRASGWNSGDEDSPIQVFIADNVDGYYEAFPPGEDRGGDIVLSSQFYDANTPIVRGTREFHEVLRAFGVAIGLKVEPSVSRFDSVMGGDLSVGPYAGDFMAEDDNILQSLYGTEFVRRRRFGDRPNPGSYSQYSPNINRVLAGSLSLGDSEAVVSQHIDLRKGKLSFSNTPFEEDRAIEVNRNGNTISGVGGSGNDLIFGNGRDNVLSGSFGSDYLQGFSGDDFLRGGNGDDWYGYRFGDGDETITEGKGIDGNWPGRDTIRLQGFGPFNFGELQDSIEFHRLGTDLRINLALDENAPDGSILIEQQAYGSFSVETIELFYDGVRSSPRISLNSVFSQLADGEFKRFRIAEGSDRFGMLVVPV